MMIKKETFVVIAHLDGIHFCNTNGEFLSLPFTLS